MIIILIVLLAVVGGAVYMVMSMRSELNEAQAANEQLQLDKEQLQLSNEFDAISTEFSNYESQIQRLDNDSIMAKYTAAKSRVEALMKELDAAKRDSKASREQIAALQAKIASLQDEIATLRALLRHYVEKIDSLGKENEGLRAENTQIRTQNEELTTRVAQTSSENAHLNERMTLAEKLNVTGVSLSALNKKGKTEKNITKATQLAVSFTIPQNNSTPVGPKTIYMRIVSPEGQVLGGAGTFKFEGGNVSYTARRTIEYAGDEISGITIYWDVNTALNPGEYTVELFVDNYRLCRRSYTMKK